MMHTADIAEYLAQGGFTTVSSMLDYNTSGQTILGEDVKKYLEKLNFFSEIEQQNFFEDLFAALTDKTEDGKDNAYKFIELIQAYDQNVAEIEAKLNQEVQSLMDEDESGYIDSLDTDSKKLLRQRITDLGVDTVANISRDYQDSGQDILTILREYGITLDDLKQKAESLHNIPLNLNVDDLNNYKGSVEDLRQEVEDITDFIHNNLNQEVLKDLDKHLKNCRSEIENIAYSIIRFDDAIQDVNEHYDE